MDILQYIIPLISTIIGAGISYFATIRLEKKKEQNERTKHVLIPFCTDLKKTTSSLPARISEETLNVLLQTIQMPCEYFESPLYFYLDKKLQEALKNYQKNVQQFTCHLEEDFRSSLRLYKNSMSSILKQYGLLWKAFEFRWDYSVVEPKLKVAILNKTQITLTPHCTSIDFFYDPNDPFPTMISLNSAIRNQWADCTSQSEKNYENLPPDVMRSYDLLDLIEKNTLTEKNILENIIQNTSSKEKLSALKEELNAMYKQTEKELKSKPYPY